MKVKLTDTNIGVFLMTILVFLDMKPFFVWDQISSQGYLVYTSVILITTLWLAYMISKKKLTFGNTPAITDTSRIYVPFLIASLGVLILFFYEVFLSGVVGGTSQPFNMAKLCIHIGLMLFCLQDNFALRSVFLNAKTIFAISLLPALIIFLLLQTGNEIPYTVIDADMGKEATGQSYRLYLGCATMLQNQNVLLPRLCGIYQEPGFVGTVGALFLIGDKITLKKWQNVVIFMASLCTFSLAFVLLFVIGCVLKIVVGSKNRKKIATAFVAVLVVVIGYSTFMSLPFDPASGLGELQNRLVITDEGLAGDNRISGAEYAERAYEDFLKCDFKTLLLGYGQDTRKVPGTEYSIWQNVHSYKEFIFNFGFAGFGILILFFVFAVLLKYKNIKGVGKGNILALLIVFLISVYQRYNIATFYYFGLLFGGASHLALSNVKDQSESDIHCALE